MSSVQGESLQALDNKNAPNTFGIKSLVSWPLLYWRHLLLYTSVNFSCIVLIIFITTKSKSEERLCPEMRVWIYLKSWEWYGKIVRNSISSKREIREMNLYGIHEILEAENPRVFDFTRLSAVVERDVFASKFLIHTSISMYGPSCVLPQTVQNILSWPCVYIIQVWGEMCGRKRKLEWQGPERFEALAPKKVLARLTTCSAGMQGPKIKIIRLRD